MEVDSLLVPAEVVAHEVYAQLATPLLWRFIREMPARGDDWADRVIGRLTHLCGKRLQSIWRIQLNDVGAPALRGLGTTCPRSGTCCAAPTTARSGWPRSSCWSCATARSTWRHPTTSRWPPTTSCCWSARPSARRLLDSTLLVDAIREYVLRGRHVPTSWIWRAITGRRA